MSGRRIIEDDFACCVPASRIPENGLDFNLAATESQCAEIAAELGIVAVISARAELTVRPWRRDGVVVEGRVHARVTQICVVSLEPIETAVDEKLVLRFNPPGTFSPDDLKRGHASAEIFIDPEAEEDPAEDLPDGMLRLGDIAREYLALGLDPYPRAPEFAGGDIDLPDPDPSDGDKEPGPFAALGKLKDVH